MEKHPKQLSSLEFKFGVAQVLLEQGYTIRATAEIMDVELSVMTRWVRQINNKRSRLDS